MTAGRRLQFLTTWVTPESCRGHGFLKSDPRDIKPKTEATVFYDLISEVTCHNFYSILLVTQANPGALWEGTIPKCEYQEV